MSVFDAGPYLSETIESILSQEGVDLEFVIVDDGSSDGSFRSLQAHAERDSRIQLLRQENQGLTRALIRGCEIARAPYIARQDAGDLSRPGRLLAQKRALDAAPELAFVSCWSEYRGPEFEYLRTVQDRGLAHEPTDIVSAGNGRMHLIDGPTCHPSVMFRTAFYQEVGGYHEEFAYAQDWDLWFRLAEVGRFQTIPQPLYVVRVLPNGISLTNRSVQHRLGELARQAFEARRQGGSETEALEEASRTERRTRQTRKSADGYYFIGEALRRNRDRQCFRYFGRALRERPVHVPTWIRLLQAAGGTIVDAVRTAP